MGIPFGIDSIDEDFYGFQPGMLITLMGRQKSGKSWSTIKSALEAWKEGYTVLVFSVEMDVNVFRQRILCLGAGVSPSRMRRGRLFPNEKEQVREFNKLLTEEEGRFLISKKKAGITVDVIREEVAQYNPNIVYIDGFSFMVDAKTGRMTSDWQANENVADALKELAMEEEIVIFVNTQVQEKQYMPKHGIEARTIASGTGLLKASDLVLGQNKDGDDITINCVYSRYEWPDTVVIDVDWETMNMVSTRAKLEDLNV
jgi:replicative DNA helicase